jgi:hypothetical protein
MSGATLAKLLATAGLALSAIGAFLLFRYGLPFKNRTGGKTYLLLEEKDEAEAALERRADRFGMTGFVLGIAGVALQIVAVWSV